MNVQIFRGVGRGGGGVDPKAGRKVGQKTDLSPHDIKRMNEKIVHRTAPHHGRSIQQLNEAQP